MTSLVAIAVVALMWSLFVGLVAGLIVVLFVILFWLGRLARR